VTSQGSPDGDTLALTARQLAASTRKEVCQSESARKGANLLAIRPSQVGCHRLMGEQERLLGDPAEATLPGRNRDVMVEERVPVTGDTACHALESQESPQEGGLADA